MQFSTSSGNPAKTRTQCVLVGIYENNKLSDTAKLFDKASKGYLKKVIGRGDISGKAGQTLMLHDVPGINAPRVMLVGCGDINGATGARYLQMLKAAVATLKKSSAISALCCLTETGAGKNDLAWKTRRLAEAFTSGNYSLTRLKGKPPASDNALQSVDVYVADKKSNAAAKAALADDSAIGMGISFAKDLGNLPGNICTPTYLADESKKLAKAYKSLTCKVLDEKEMQKLGMGSLLSVGHGSAEPSKLIVIQHKGGKAKAKPHVLVGKGITFDTGGISLKSAGTMYDMIYDMCGAASVMGAMKTVAEQNLPINIIAVIAAAENMPSDRATRPGDIVTSMSGQTIEVLNTDAEGRLVLCDALTYVDKFDPETVIDVATLTGACVVALGSHASALYANDDKLAQDITEAGEDSLDRVWRMPLWDEYQPQINSAFADMANIGGPQAGSITAACFLSRFTKKYRWAHLDIAGSAFKGGTTTKGSTGRPVGLLVQYLMDRVAESK